MKNILISGISKGLGLETAKILLVNNYCVYGISRSETEEIKELSSLYPKRFFWISYDLKDLDSIKQSVFEEFIPFSVPIYAFINNAAIAYDDIITNLNINSLESMYKINVFAPMLITKFVIRNMLYNKVMGSIVHVSSISVHTGYKGLAMYASTKGAIEAFSKNTAREWGVKKIRSNCVVAGFMETNMSSSLSEDQKEKIYRRTSLKSTTAIGSVANTIEFLLSDKSESITGQNIFVDSGTI